MSLEKDPFEKVENPYFEMPNDETEKQKEWLSNIRKSNITPMIDELEDKN